MEEKSSRIKEEIIGVLAIAAGIVIFVSLISHNQWDRSFSTDSPELKNLLGRFGSYVSDILLQVMGLTSWLIPVILLISGTRRVLGRPAQQRQSLFIISCILLILSVSSLLTLTLGSHSGGAIGVISTNLTKGIISTIGSYLLFGTLTLVTLMYLIQFSLINMFAAVKGRVSSGSRILAAMKERKMKTAVDEAAAGLAFFTRSRSASILESLSSMASSLLLISSIFWGLQLRFLHFPGWEKPEHNGQYEEWQDKPYGSHKHPFRTYQSKFKTGEPVKALREQLSPHNHIPSHKENSHQYQQSRYKIDGLAYPFSRFVQLEYRQGDQGNDGSNRHLHGQEGEGKFPRYQQRDDLEGFLGFVDPVDLVERFQGKIQYDHEEQVPRNGIQGLHVNGVPSNEGNHWPERLLECV